MMNEEEYLSLLDRFEKGFTPPSLGWQLTEYQFSWIASEAAKSIHKNSWEWYIDYMNSWRLGVINDKQ